MTDLTDDQVRALLDGNELRSDSQSHTVWLLARALLQARADAAAAQSLMVERAVDLAKGIAESCAGNVTVYSPPMAGAHEELRLLHTGGEQACWQVVAAIRALAPDAGVAELARLRDERDAAVRDAAEWATIAADNSDRADTLTASLAQANLRAKNAYMRGLLDSAQHLRSTIPDNPDGWEQIESMARMLDAMAHRAAARHIAEGQTK